MLDYQFFRNLPMTTADFAHVRFTVYAVIATNGEDPDYVAQRMNSAFGHAIGNGAITGDTEAETVTIEAGTRLLSPEAASLDEQVIASWISNQIESGSMTMDDVAKLMARYALADPASMREEFVERMGLYQSSDDGEPELQVAR